MPDIFLWSVPSDADRDDVRLRDPTVGGGGAFPTQFPGLRYCNSASVVEDLCLVAVADGPTGIGGVLEIRHPNGTTYAIYLVDVADPDASQACVRTTTLLKAIRLKT